MDAVDRIKPAVRVGDRLVIRYRLPDGSATDVIGWLQEGDDDQLRVRDHSGADTEVERRTVVAARRVPAARGGPGPMRTSPDQLEHITMPGWVAQHEPLGEWTLRAGGRFTGRANSCMAVGDPGIPPAAAAQRIVGYAAERGCYPWAQVIEGSEPERQLRALGWTDVYVPTDVLVARLADLLEGTRADPDVHLASTLEPSWWQAYLRSRPSSADPAVVRQVLESEPPVAFAGVGQQELLAIGRGHLSADWLGVASIWTEPEHRRRGWAARVLTTLGHWAARQGARNAYLQVAAENAPAHRAYARLGFTRHHGYLYLGPP
jgi:ribosomal protein S18 acetylase RimI-like enzyme